MKITNCIVEKMSKDDPRYPDAMPERPFTDVYRCEITFECGRKMEAVCFITGGLAEQLPADIGRMLKFFARAVERAELAEAA